MSLEALSLTPKAISPRFLWGCLPTSCNVSSKFAQLIYVHERTSGPICCAQRRSKLLILSVSSSLQASIQFTGLSTAAMRFNVSAVECGGMSLPNHHDRVQSNRGMATGRASLQSRPYMQGLRWEEALVDSVTSFTQLPHAPVYRICNCGAIQFILSILLTTQLHTHLLV